MITQLAVNGLHTASGGDGVKDGFYDSINAAGKRFCAKGADALPHYALSVAQNSQIDHVIVYRISVPYDDGPAAGIPSLPPSGDTGVPEYHLDPEAAADRHANWHLDVIEHRFAPGEFDKAIVYIEITNETAYDLEHASWMGHFATAAAKIINGRGYRFAAFGFASGNPDLGAWETPGMLEYLHYCAALDDPYQAIVALHEYSLSRKSIWTKAVEGEGIIDTTPDDPDAGYLVGRFRLLFEACDDLGIRRPFVVITEWGWTETAIPASIEVAKEHIISAGEWYAQWPEVLGCAVWYLGPGYGGIAQQALKLVDPLEELVVSTEYVIDEPGDGLPPLDEDEKRAAWSASVAYQIEHGIQLNADAGIQKAAFADGNMPPDALVPVHNEMPFNGRVYQAYETLAKVEDGGLPRQLYGWSNEEGVFKFENPYGDDEPVPQIDSLFGLHYRADPDMGSGVEFAEFKELGGTGSLVIKAMNDHPPEVYRRLVADQISIGNDPTECWWVIRIHYSFGDRVVMPEQFYNDSWYATQTAVNVLMDEFGIPGERIVIELHNEPNIRPESWGVNWFTGASFASYFGAVLTLYRELLPDVLFAYPGLSPGDAIDGFRQDAHQFLQESLDFANRCDVFCVHGYWSRTYAMAQTMVHIDAQMALIPGKPVIVSEASNNEKDNPLTAQEMAAEYVLFLGELHERGIAGVAFFVSSASNQADFGHESWVTDPPDTAVSKGIAREIVALVGS